MKNKKIMIVGIILVVLVGLYLGINQYQNIKQEKQAEEEAGKKIVVTQLENISGISYSNKETTLSFEKKNEEWIYLEDLTFPLDSSYITYMISAYGNIIANKELTTLNDLEYYGLADPAYRIQLTAENGEITTILIGHEEEGICYVTVDEKTIYTVNRTIIDAMDFEIESMILNDKFPSINIENLVQVKIAEQGVETIYTKTDQQAITTCAQGLSGFTFEELVNYYGTEEDIEFYGLSAENRIEISVTYEEDGGEKEVVFYVGDQVEDSDYYYVQLKGSNIIYKSTREIVENCMNKNE